jgi:hypothetical protein
MESKDENPTNKSIKEEIERLIKDYELPEPKELEYRLSEFEFKHEQLKEDIIQIYKARYNDSQDFREILRSLLGIIETDEYVMEKQKKEKRELEYLLYGHSVLILIVSLLFLFL